MNDSLGIKPIPQTSNTRAMILLGASLVVATLGVWGVGAGVLALLVAPAAGAVCTRVLLRESCLLRLLAIGTVAGTGAQWLGLWLLLPLWPGAGAAVSTMVLLVGVAAWLWKSGEGRNLPPLELPTALEGVGLLLLFSLVAGSVYLTSAPLLGFSETMIFHIPVVASMERGNIPPINLQEPPNVLYYHYAEHVLAAGLSAVGRLPAHIALFAVNSFFAGIAALFAYVLGKQGKSIATGFAAALLLVGAGTLNWLAAPTFASEHVPLAQLFTPLGLPFSTGNIAIGSFVWRVHGNSMAWATCLSLLVCTLLCLALGRRQFRFAWPAAVALALLAPANETLFCVTAAAAGIAPFWYLLQERRLCWRRIAIAAAVCTAGTALIFLTGGVMKTFFLDGSATHGATVKLDLGNFGTVPSWDFGRLFPPGEDGRVPIFSLYFLRDVGPLPFLLVPALVWAARRRDNISLFFGTASLVSLLVASAFTLTRYPENIFRLVNLCVVLSGIPIARAALGVVKISNSRLWRATTGFVAGALLSLCIANWPLLHVGINAIGVAHSVPADGGPESDAEAIEFLVENTDFRDGVLSIPYGSWAVLGSGQVAPTGSYVGGDVSYAVDSEQAVTALDLGAMRQLGVRYVYVDSARMNPDQQARLGELLESEQLKSLWTAEDRSRFIYEIGRDSSD